MMENADEPAGDGVTRVLKTLVSISATAPVPYKGTSCPVSTPEQSEPVIGGSVKPRDSGSSCS